MPHHRQQRRLRAASAAGVAVIALAVAAPVAPAAAAPGPVTAAASAKKKTKKKPAAKKRLTKRQKARERARLRKLVRQRPRSFLTRSFLRRAALVDFTLPATMRLNTPGTASDDQLAVEWNTDAAPWPALGEPWPTPTTITIDGVWAMELVFGDAGSGYGIGTIEAQQGMGVRLAGGGFPIAAFGPTQCDPLAEPAGPLLEAGPWQTRGVAAPTAANPARYAALNIISQTVTGALNLDLRFTSVLRACDDTTTLTRSVDPESERALIGYSGTFKLSPAITPDGQLRFGKIGVADEPAGSQRSVFSRVWSCAATATSADPCTPSGAPGEAQALPFPGRLTVQRLTADILLGGEAYANWTP